MWCRNCDRPEPGGGRCKFCGRKLLTISKLPHELRSAGMASKTFTFYGFNHCFSRKFSGAGGGVGGEGERLVPSRVLVEVPYPDQTPIAKRAELQALKEDDDFDRCVGACGCDEEHCFARVGAVARIMRASRESWRSPHTHTRARTHG